MESVAIKDAQGRFKFGPVKYKESGNRFKEQRRRSSKHGVLFLRYDDSDDPSRCNQLALYEYKKKKEYTVVFLAGKLGSGNYFKHIINIHCDPSKGIEVNLSGPYRHFSGEVESYDTEYVSGMPPRSVIEIVNGIRNELKIEEEDGNSGGNTYNNYIHNEGNLTGDGNGSIIFNDSNHRGGRRHQTK